MTNTELVNEIKAAVEAVYATPAEATETTIRVGTYRNTVVSGGDADVQAARIINERVFELDAALPDFDEAVTALETLAADKGIASICRI